MFFFLTVHEPSWLDFMPVPLFISYHRLARTGRAARKTFPRARLPWALDSGGFTELSEKGCWTIKPKEYLADVRTYMQQIGNLAWATPQDWMCEACVLHMTGLQISEHQRRTVASFLEFKALAPEVPWIPVLQGWTLGDYLDCVELYDKAGVDLLAEPVVGVGTMCRRQDTMPAVMILTSLAELGINMHGFGVKKEGLEIYGSLLESSDSLAWSMQANKGQPLPWSKHHYFKGKKMHKHCNNCPDFALDWRSRLIEGYEHSVPSQHQWQFIRDRGNQARDRAGVDRDPHCMIGVPYSFISLASLEGDGWMQFQVANADEPYSYVANRERHLAGGAASQQEGIMLGGSNRVYIVEPSGEIVLQRDTVAAQDLPRFKRRVRLV